MDTSCFLLQAQADPKGKNFRKTRSARCRVGNFRSAPIYTKFHHLRPRAEPFILPISSHLRKKFQKVLEPLQKPNFAISRRIRAGFKKVKSVFCSGSIELIKNMP